MTTRNITKKFETLRSQAKSSNISHTRSEWETSDGKSALLSSDSHSDSSSLAQVGFSHTLPPKWVDIVDDVNEDFIKIKESMTILQDAHASRLRVSFGDDESEKERRIEEATAKVGRHLKSAEAKIKKIAMMGSDEGLSQPEKIVRLNVMRHLGSELNALSKSYRSGQKDFMEKLKAQQNVGKDFLQDVSNTQVGTFEDALDRGLSEEQMMALREIEERADDREKEIIHLVQSINDLASLFQELNMLVIEQGTILDRIDYNVEQTLVKVQEGNIELRKADDYSRKTPTLKCILILIVVIIVETIILIVKHR